MPSRKPNQDYNNQNNAQSNPGRLSTGALNPVYSVPSAINPSAPSVPSVPIPGGLPAPRSPLTIATSSAHRPNQIVRSGQLGRQPPTAATGASRTFQIRLIPHLDSRRSLRFDAITRELKDGDVAMRVGRLTNRSGMGLPAANALGSNKLAFASKVVSRAHAEIWVEKGGKFFIRDTKSSSGTFLNNMRLSHANHESGPYQLKDGDIIQLGVDYRGGAKDIYTSVKIRVELGREWQAGANPFNTVASKNLQNFVKPAPSQVPFLISEPPPVNRGNGDAQSRGAGGGDNLDFSIPKEAPTITKELHSVDCGDKVVQLGDAPSTSFFQGPSIVEITGSPNFYDIRGNATIIRFGDGQFTDVQKDLICDYIANLTVLPDINYNLKRHVLTQSIISLPRAKAVFDDYQNKKKSGPCFKGTREALLREMADWVTTSSESRMYILSGLAGIGKSTVAYTIASRAADLNLLGASFFFSRDEADRKNAEFFFTTIAYQLCVYNETFAKTIGDVLMTERGSAATTKDPHDQLRALILEPLRGIIQSYSQPILIVVDALDECDGKDVLSVLTGLTQLVQALPSFKIILTTRPQLQLDRFFGLQHGHKVFHLQDIENKVVDRDIRLYFNHWLSLEKVRECLLTSQWCASDKEIDALVRAAGRLFIIASTVVRIILDEIVSNPAAQMQKLLSTFSQDRMPFKDLNEFYTVVLRNVVPADCDENIVNRYQSVVGAIIFLQHPLPITTLAHLIDRDVEETRGVLVNLRSVILLGDDDIPRVYHKSFPDYITDSKLCQDIKLCIDPIMRHTQIVTRCFEIMDKHLKRNILDLGDPARFMNNEDGFKEDGITDEQIQEKIPQQLRYACVYWVNHLEVANIEDEGLMKGLERFAHEHMLYWFEVLSLIGKLDSAHRAITVVVKLLTLTSSDLHQLLSDALRFISKFYEIIKRSALHTYYSALPFTPTTSLLYDRYIKEADHNICSIQGGPEKWDALVANLRHEGFVKVIKFSFDNTLVVSYSEGYGNNGIREQGKLKVWDAATGTPISMIPGDRFAVANNFSTVVSSQGNITTLYNVDGSPSGAMITTSSTIEGLAISSEIRRVAAGLSDGTVWLWDSENTELIDRFDGFKGRWSRLQFSPTGTRLAYSSANGITLRDGTSGRFIADLHCGSLFKFEFSEDGSRIASVSFRNKLTLWNSDSGGLITTVRDVSWHCSAISEDGSLLATVDEDKVTLWREDRGHLAQIKVLEVGRPSSMAFSLDNIFAIVTTSNVKLYNVKTHSFIHTLPLGGLSIPPAFSPDCTRLAVTGPRTDMKLWDIRGIDTSTPSSKENATVTTALTVSRDCSRLACGFKDGTVELWRTSRTKFTKQRISPLALRSKVEKLFIRIFGQSRRTKSVQALAFDPHGRLFASGSHDQIKLWYGGDGVLRRTLKVPGVLEAVALSNSMLVAAWVKWENPAPYGCITLWSLDKLSLSHTFKISHSIPIRVSIAENSTLIAVCCPCSHSHVTLYDVVNRTTVRTFDVPFYIHTMTFVPDNSYLVVQSNEGVFQSFDLISERIRIGPTLKHLVQLSNIPLWHGVPVWHCEDKEQHYFSALFSRHKNAVPVLWIPRQIPVATWIQGSSMIALGCDDGRVILLRLATNQIS